VLTTRPELLDSLVYGHQELPSELDDALEVLMDRKLISEIRASIDFQESRDPLSASQTLSSTADQIALDLKHIVKSEIANSDFRIFAMGKWGTNELSFHSDLDFIMVKPGQISEQDHKAAKRFINYLRSPQRGGKIYDIDLRLRPSGSSGPLLVTLDSFAEYVNTRAQTWERQSYLKLRPLDQSLDIDFSASVQKGLSADELADLKSIRGKLLKARCDSALDLKYAPGGLVDIELGVQTALLNQRIPARGSTLELSLFLANSCSAWSRLSGQLCENYLKLRQVELAYRLVTQSSELLLQRDKSSFEDAASLIGESRLSFWKSLGGVIRSNQELLKELDPIYSKK
jgi:glutamate-ammonia-ligase adenylyltransferase